MQQKTLLNPTDGPSIKMLLPILIPILRNTIFLRQRANASNYTAIDTLAIFDILTIAFCAYWVYQNCTSVMWKRLWSGTVKCWLGYYLFALISVFWRIKGSNALYIFYRAGTMLILAPYIYMIFMQFRSARSAFKGLLNYILALTIFMFLGNIRLGAFHTNTYTVSAAVMVCLSLSAYRNKLFPLKEMTPYIYIGLFLLFIGTSSASNVSFVCGLIFIYCFKNKRFHFSMFIMLLLSLFAAYYFGKQVFFPIIFPHKSESKLFTLHGRAVLWEHYIRMWLRRPFRGWGFAVGERSGRSFGYIYALSAHNGYISILINTGLLGMSFWIVLFKRLIKSLILQIIFDSPYAIVIASAFVIIAVNNNSIPTFGSNWGSLSTLTFSILSFWHIWCENAPKDFYCQSNS